MVLLSIWRYVKFVLELNESNGEKIALDDCNVNLHIDSMLVFMAFHFDNIYINIVTIQFMTSNIDCNNL